MLEKDLLRKAYLSLRKQLTSTEKAIMNQSIALQFLEMLHHLFRPNDLFILHTYLNNKKWIEVDTASIIEQIKISFPHCTLCSPHITDNENMESLDLKNQSLIQPNDIDIMIVPVLVADIHGNRLGYGKGYYDRYIKRCDNNIITVGLSWFPPLQNTLPISIDDVALRSMIYPKADS